MLTGRTAATLADRLRRHPDAQVVCRDRAFAYGEAIRDAAPQARLVADRWHVWANLTEAVEKCVLAHRGCLNSPVPVTAPPVDTPPSPPLPAVEGRLTARTRQRHAAIRALSVKGVSIGVIAETLGPDRKTVRRSANTATAEELLHPRNQRNGSLRLYLTYLHQRWNEGCTDAGTPTPRDPREGIPRQRTQRAPLAAAAGCSELPAPAVSEGPTVQVTRWLTCRPRSRSPQDTQRLTGLLDRCPQLKTAAEHVAAFAVLLTGRCGDELPAWIRAVDAAGPPQLRGFALNLNKDPHAVIAGLTLHWNSDMVEGHVNSVKALKRAVFGRARLDLLRQCIVLPD